MTNDTWGLNFTSPIDAKQFRECCVSTTDFLARLRVLKMGYASKLAPTASERARHPVLYRVKFARSLALRIDASFYCHDPTKCGELNVNKDVKLKRTVFEVQPDGAKLSGLLEFSRGTTEQRSEGTNGEENNKLKSEGVRDVFTRKGVSKC